MINFRFSKFFIAGLSILATITSCSNNDDESFQKPVEENGYKTITVGAPVINPDGSDKGTTRIAFDYENISGDKKGLNISWEGSTDKIIITPMHIRSNNYWGREQQREYQADDSGATTTFSATGYEAKTGSGYAYVITYPTGLYTVTNGSPSTITEGWTTRSCYLSDNNTYTQQQTGNNNTDHLKNYYYAVLKNVNTYNNIQFSSTWASTNKYVPTNGGTNGEPTTAECGLFIQSTCIKFDLTIPADNNLTDISYIHLQTRTSGGVSAKTMYNYLSETGDGYYDAYLKVSTTDFTPSTEYHLQAYLMYPARDWVLPEGYIIKVGVYDSSSNVMAKTSSAKSAHTVKAGSLATIKFNNTNWNKSW